MTKGVRLVRHEIFHEVRFVRPDTMNTLTLDAINELERMLAEIETERSRCVLFTAEGRNFMAGGDLDYLKKAGDNSPQEARAVIAALNGLFLRLLTFPCPTVIAMQGAVAGAGISLLLACDWAIAADNCRFVFAYEKIATTPDGGLTWTLPRAIGFKQAVRIALSAEPLLAEEAFRLGILADIASAGELQQAGEAAATRLAKGPTLAYAATRNLMLESHSSDLESHLGAELESFCDHAATADFRGAVDAFFERRQPEFHGR